MNAVTISSEFRKEMSESENSKTINYCYQCGMCSGICPSFRVNTKFNPRRIVEDILLGFKDKLLNDKIIWSCTTCHSCLEVCPQGVLVSEMLFELRHKSIERGMLPDNLRDEGERFSITGLNIGSSPAIIRRRKQLGLEEEIMIPITENIKIICETTNLIEMIKKKEEEDGGNE